MSNLETNEEAFKKGMEAHENGDYDTAITEWEPIAEQGHVEAQYNLGLMYAYAGDPEFYSQAVKWLRLSAEQGHADAQVNLGLLYSDGLGVPKDEEQAIKWYRLAAAQGNAGAQDLINAENKINEDKRELKGAKKNLVSEIFKTLATWAVLLGIGYIGYLIIKNYFW